MDPDQIAELLDKRAWVPLAAFVIFWLTRLFKSDTKFFPTIPPRARILLVVGLGFASAVLEKVIQGKTWTSALVGGATSLLLAMFFHESLIASIRKGKELPIPGLIKLDTSPSPGAPVTKPSNPPPDE